MSDNNFKIATAKVPADQAKTAPMPAEGPTPHQDVGPESFTAVRNSLRAMINPPLKVYNKVIWASIMVNLFTLSFPLITMSVYQTVLPASATQTLIALSLGVLLILGFDWFFNQFRMRTILSAQTDADRKVARALYNNIARAKLDGRILNGAILLATARDFDQARSNLAAGVITALVDAPFVVLFVILLILTHPLIGSVAFIGVVIILIAGVYSAYQVRRIQKIYGRASMARHTVMVDTVRDFAQAKSTGWIEHLIDKHEPTADDMAVASAHMQYVTQNAGLITKTLVQSVQTLITLSGAWAVIQGELGMAALIGFSMLGARTAAMAGQLSSTLPRWVQAKDALDQIEEAINLPQEKDPQQDYITQLSEKPDLQFHRVSFSYPEMPVPAISDVNFTVPAGKTALFMGKSGAGKSSLLNLCAGLFKPGEGHIRFGRIELSYIDPDVLRQYIGVVASEPVLYGDTLAEWLTMGLQDVSLNDAELMLKELGFEDVINEHPRAIHRPIEAGGKSFSIGQKKSMALTRALLSKAPIILLDEPTEGLDSEHRALLIQALRHHTKDKTVLIASHDENLIQLADYIGVIGRGRLVVFDEADIVRSRFSAGKISDQPPR